jgi:hypothetical protein
VIVSHAETTPVLEAALAAADLGDPLLLLHGPAMHH